MSLDSKIALMKSSIDDMGTRVHDKRIEGLSYLNFLSGPKDNLFHLKGEKFEDGLRLDEVCRRQYIVTNDAELQQAFSTTENFEEVFNTWKRFSHRAEMPQPADINELNTWELVDGNIYNLTNSTTCIGFVSPESYTDYEFEVNVSSTANDDDYIGVIAGFAEVDGHQFTLSAFRSGGSGRLWNIIYNFAQGTIVNNAPYPQLNRVNANFTLDFPDGVVDPNRPSAPSNNSYGSWRDVPHGCRIKVIRTGDVITFKTTNWSRDGSVMPWNEDATHVLDLNFDPRFAKFKNASPIGYMCQSQASSTWKVISRPQSRKDILDARTNTV